MTLGEFFTAGLFWKIAKWASRPLPFCGFAGVTGACGVGVLVETLPELELLRTRDGGISGAEGGMIGLHHLC